MPGKSGGLLYEDFLKQLPEDLYGLKMPGVHFSEDAKTAAGVAEPPEEAVAGANDGPPGVSKSTGGTELYAPAKVNPLISGGSRGIQAIQDLLNGFRGNYSPGWYGVKQGRSPQHFDSPVLAGSKELAQLPLTQETEKVGYQNKVRDLLNQATMFNMGTGRQNAQTALDIATKESGAKEAGLERTNKLDIAKLLAGFRTAKMGDTEIQRLSNIQTMEEALDGLKAARDKHKDVGPLLKWAAGVGGIAARAGQMAGVLPASAKDTVNDAQKFSDNVKFLSNEYARNVTPGRTPTNDVVAHISEAKIPGGSASETNESFDRKYNALKEDFKRRRAMMLNNHPGAEERLNPALRNEGPNALDTSTEVVGPEDQLTPEKRARLEYLRQKALE